MRHFFVSIYRFFEKKPLLLWLFLLLLVGSGAWGITKLDFVEDISSFFPQNDDNKRVSYAYQHIGASNRIVINIKENTPDNTAQEVDYELLTNAVDSLVTQLNTNDTAHLIKDILYEVNEQQIGEITNFIVQNMPYFLTEQDYRRMDTLLTKEHIARQLEIDKSILASPIGSMQTVILSDPLFFSSDILKNLSNFQLNDQYHEENGYIFNKTGDEAIVVVTSQYPVSETSNNAILIDHIEKAIATAEKTMNGKVDMSPFGASLVSLTNSQQIKKDSFIAVLLALVLIIGLLIFYYRSFRSILLIGCSILFGGVIALGIIVLFKNPISIIAVGAASIIFGIAVNYPIHFLSHFKKTDNKEQIIKDIVNPLLIGNLTTVGAFLSLLFISSDAMRDLGLFAALLLIGTIIFVLIFLPHFLGKKRVASVQKTYKLSFGKIANLSPEKHPWFVIIILLLTCVFFVFSFQTSFETNMHKINYMTPDQKAAFDEILAESDTTVQTIYCVAEGNTFNEALQNNESIQPQLAQLLADSTIKKCSGIGDFLPSVEMQKRRLQQWNEFWKGRDAKFWDDLKVAAQNAGFTAEAFSPCKAIIEKEYSPQPPEYFQPILQNLAESYVMTDNDKSMIYNVLSVDKSRKADIENRLNQQNEHVFAFTDSSIVSRMVEALSGDFNYVLFFCGLIVLVFLLFSFGRIEIALMSFIPLTLAWIWILGLMGIFDVKFNIVNIILATFIFGQGDDYTIFVTEGVMYEYRTGKKMLAQFKNSIILSSLIMFIGIGTLIFAKHPAMRSLAEVTIVGMISVVMMAYIIPPLIFRWLTRKKDKLRLMPITLLNLLKTIVSFIVFAISSVLLTILTSFFYIIGYKNEKLKNFYHILLCATLRILSKMMLQVKFKLINPHNERFHQPSVIICNHQSHLDLLYTLLLSPKIIVVTNRWAWNMPFYRMIVRYADFLPVGDGVEENYSKLKKMVEKGYSILIFPEGTRSEDFSILRFHQGAFRLAQQLQLDILPIVIHGTGYVLPKTEFMLRKGGVTISILKRINSEDIHFRKNIQPLSMARLFRKLFKEEYEKLSQTIENVAYYQDLVWHNYIYKGREVAQKARSVLKNRKGNEQFVASLPNRGNVLIKHCGQGERTLLAALIKKDLHITAVDEDEELLSIAQFCTSVPKNLVYEQHVPDDKIYDCIIENKNKKI